MRWRYSFYSLGVRITLGGADELPLAAIETINHQKIERISIPVLSEVTNNSEGPGCVVECGKHKREKIKAIEKP